MTAPTYIDPGLLDFATDAQKRYCEAINLHGSARAAARALGVAPNSVSGAIERLRKEATFRGYAPDHDMTHTVPDGFKVRGVSTYYDRGRPKLCWFAARLTGTNPIKFLGVRSGPFGALRGTLLKGRERRRRVAMLKAAKQGNLRGPAAP